MHRLYSRLAQPCCGVHRQPQEEGTTYAGELGMQSRSREVTAAHHTNRTYLALCKKVADADGYRGFLGGQRCARMQHIGSKV